ncbi:HEAT repeat-containing protein [Dyadobacter soli]|uniref:HEAT repeat-containing protein n=1 Tax=Dyadobacter soli TaxID=659014 RepID=A0A1G7UJT1_9BACT|nr:HEAT repeat domain-containing protein [Dyadobacter soli]SDG47511.1 HEAT repeat-containing protein [Dyadobacter soli]
MEPDIEKLLEKYYDGETSLEEERALKQFFQSGQVPEHLQSHAAQFGYFANARKEQPSLNFNHELAMRLDPRAARADRPAVAQGAQGTQGLNPGLGGGRWMLRVAAGLALLIVGFGAGWLVQSRSENGALLAALEEKEAGQVAEMKKVLAFEQMNSTSASERIQAVNHSYTIPDADRDITQLLINTLNFDPNVNVRLAACQALTHFADEAEVKEALIQSLAIQTDPNIQISLIEALVAIKEKRALDQFQQLARDQEVLDVVRLKATEGMNRLTTDV